MKKTILTFVLLLPFKGHTFILNEHYKNGDEVCLLHQKEIEHEYSRWINVPVDYEHPGLESTKIYAYTKKPFDSNLPSLLLFPGGPGESSRNNEFSLPHFNIIYFEQRGISCSRPKSRELFLDPKFYSSLNTARDAKMVIDAYGIKKIAVFGHSYGTIPGTIFSSLFPDRTQVLLLEGVIYQADQSLWLSKKRNKMLQDLFDSLTVELQDKILKLSEEEGVPAAWYSHLGYLILQINGVDAYKQFLESIFSNEYLDLKSFVSGYFRNPNKPEEEFSYGDVMTGMIACQEMNMADPEMSLTTIFSNKKLVSDHINREREANCVPLGLENNKNTPYDASQYPVSVPVAYLLGSEDPATTLDQGLNHYQNVAVASKQLLVMEHGGHFPSFGLLKEIWDCQEADGGCDSTRQNKIQRQIFEQLAKGDVDDTSTLNNLINDFNRAGSLKWRIGVEALRVQPESQSPSPAP